MSDSTSDYNISYSKENLIKIQHVGVTAKMQQQPLKMLLCNNYSTSTGTDGGEDAYNQYSHDLSRNQNSNTKYNKFSNENFTDCTVDKNIFMEGPRCDHRMQCIGDCKEIGETDSTITTDNSPAFLYRMKTIGCVSDKKYKGQNLDCAEVAGERNCERNYSKMTPSKIEFELCNKHCSLKSLQKSKRRKAKRRLFVSHLSGVNRCHKRCHGHIKKRNKSFIYKLRRPFVKFYVKCNRNRINAYKSSCNSQFQPSQTQPITIDNLLNDYPNIDDNNRKQEQNQQPQQQQQQQQKHCYHQNSQQYNNNNNNHKLNNNNISIGIYPFDHGCPEYLKAYDLPPQVFSSVINEQTVLYTTRFWAEFFGTIHIGVAFVITFILQAYRFVLFSLINTLLVGVLHMTSDYLIKPLLAVLFNGFVQPPLLFGFNVLASVRDLFAPVADILDNFMKPIARVGNSFRLVHVHYDKRSIMKGV